MVHMASGSTTSTEDPQAGVAHPPPTEVPTAGVGQRFIVHVPARPAQGPPSVLGGLLPRTGVTIAILLAIIALLIIAVGVTLTRVAQRLGRASSRGEV
jgi:hypothetical protein